MAAQYPSHPALKVACLPTGEPICESVDCACLPCYQLWKHCKWRIIYVFNKYNKLNNKTQLAGDSGWRKWILGDGTEWGWWCWHFPERTHTYPSLAYYGLHLWGTKACFVHFLYFSCFMMSYVCSLCLTYDLSFLSALFRQGIRAEMKRLTAAIKKIYTTAFRNSESEYFSPLKFKAST